MSAALEEPQTTPAPEPAEPDTEPDTEPDEPGGGELEPDAQPSPESLSDKEIEKRIAALEREKERHAKRVSEILQEEALDLVVCEACEVAIPGFHYPAAMYPPSDPRKALYELLAGGQDAQMQHPTRYVTCGTCNGFGQVLTGARNDLNRLIICADCKGAGFHDTQTPAAPVVTLTQQNTLAAPSTGAPPSTPAEDFLGRPFGHPNYGLMTAYMTPEQIALDKQDGFGL